MSLPSFVRWRSLAGSRDSWPPWLSSARTIDLSINHPRHVRRCQCCCRGSSTKSPMMLLPQRPSTCLTAQPAADLLPIRSCAQFSSLRPQGRRATLKVSAFESQAQPWKKSPAASSSRCAAAPALLFLSPVGSAACRLGSACRSGCSDVPWNYGEYALKQGSHTGTGSCGPCCAFHSLRLSLCGPCAGAQPLWGAQQQ